ncbi:MAG: hypothetical protein WC861_03435 [Candidatus Micrarchaeia archaeon]|jgi:hypothetical protein
MQTRSATPKGKAERLSAIASSYFFLALEHRRNGKFVHFLERAEALHGLAAKEEPSSPVHLNNRALVREAREDFEGAFLDFKAAEKLCNGNDRLRAAVENNALKTETRLGIEKQGPIAEPRLQ